MKPIPYNGSWTYKTPLVLLQTALRAGFPQYPEVLLNKDPVVMYGKFEEKLAPNQQKLRCRTISIDVGSSCGRVTGEVIVAYEDGRHYPICVRVVFQGEKKEFEVQTT